MVAWPAEGCPLCGAALATHVCECCGSATCDLSKPCPILVEDDIRNRVAE